MEDNMIQIENPQAFLEEVESYVLKIEAGAEELRKQYEELKAILVAKMKEGQHD